MADQRFLKKHHLRSPADFDRVYAARAFATDSVLVVNGCSNQLPHARLGLSVSRKVGNAVVRNEWKRKIREAFRLQREKLPTGVDLVVRPQKDAAADFHAIAGSLAALAQRIARRLKRDGRTGEVGRGSHGETID